MKNINNLKPFPKFCHSIGYIPTSYKISMTYEEQLWWFCDFLENKVIPTVNQNAEALEELQNLYIQLKQYVDDYFSDLNVQTQIDNKLDEMVESGELQDILLHYVDLTKTYDIYSDFIDDADNLVNGQKIKIMGYYQVGDGGESEYYITDTSSSDYQIDLNNGLYATLIVNDFVNAVQLGCKKDGSEDISSIINNALDYFTSFYFPIGKYKINSSIDLSDKQNIIFRGESYTTYTNTMATMFVGNTGNDPMFNLLGTKYINFNNFNIFSDDQNLSTPSVLAILQGCTTDHPFSQWIYFNNIHINLISSPNSNNLHGSIGIYNYQSELNNYTNCFIHADIPIALLQDDDFGIATSFGAIQPQHNSLTGNTYVNLETQSKLKYTACLSGSGNTFVGFYGQGCVKFFTNTANSNEINDYTLIGVIENNNSEINDSAIEIGTNAKLQNSLIQVMCVQFVHYLTSETSGIITTCTLKFSGYITGSYAPTNTRFQNNIIYKGGLTIENLYSQGNIVIGGGYGAIMKNKNLSVGNDGTLYYDDKAILFTNAMPSRNDLPNQSIAFNMLDNRFMCWKYASSINEWQPVGVGRPMNVNYSDIATMTPGMPGQIIKDVTNNDIYMAYGTSQGNWKKIT